MDFWRQLDLFDPVKFGNKKVNIIGCGAVGSYVTYLLSKIGVRNLTLWDFDKVQSHNTNCQTFGVSDIGKYKAEALAEAIKLNCNFIPDTTTETVTKDSELSGIVFLMVDTMSARKDIWEAIKLNPNIELMIETRMAIDNGRVYTIRPCCLSDIEAWEKTLYSDEEAEESPCTFRSIAPTVAMIASIAVWKLIKYYNHEDYSRGVILSMRPAEIIRLNK